MEKTTKYLILAIGSGIGAYIPTIFGASAFGLWSILGSFVGGVAAIIVIVRMDE